MPRDAPGHAISLLVIGPDDWTFPLARKLQSGLPTANIERCLNTTQALRLPTVSQVSAILALVTANETDTGLTELASTSRLPPLLIIATQDAPAGFLLELMMQGAAGLLRDGDDATLDSALARLTSAGANSAPRKAAAPPTDSGSALAGLRVLADRTPSPLALVVKETIVHANPAFCRLLGLSSASQAVQRPLLDHAMPSSVKPLQALLARTALLDEGETPGETLEFRSASGVAVAAQVSVSPLPIVGGEGLAVSLSSSGPVLKTETGAGTSPDVSQERAALLARLAVLTDENSAVERRALLALALVADFGSRRSRLGFAATMALMVRLADHLKSAAPPESTSFIIADDVVALLAEDISSSEADRLRQRIVTAVMHSSDEALRQLQLDVGTVLVTPDAGTASQLLDQALAQARPEEATELETSLTLDAGVSEFSTEVAPLSEVTSPPQTMADRPLLQHPPAILKLALEDSETVVKDPIMDRIEHALAGEGFVLAFQPIVSLVGDSREHYSVLVRLKTPNGGMTTATQILAAASGQQRMADIDRWVIQSALRVLGRRRRQGEKAAFFLSLSQEIVEDDHLLIWICDAMREFEVRGSWLTFQMRQQDAQAQSERWSKLAQGLREVKCRICVNQQTLALEDTPADNAPPNFVKFAPSLAAGLSDDRDKQRHLLEMIRSARNQDIRTVVTGIEDSRALSLLWDAGIEYVQGDYLCPPKLDLDHTEDPSPLPEQSDATIEKLVL